jgi:hypothetical protein
MLLEQDVHMLVNDVAFSIHKKTLKVAQSAIIVLKLAIGHFFQKRSAV